MKPATFDAEAEIEAAHWWFVVRRELFSDIIRKLGVRRDARILDVGTSTGTNLRMLRDLEFTNVQGLDLNEHAIRYCKEKGLGDVRQGSIYELPFESSSFDLVLATDVIEHLDDDMRGLQEVSRVLKPGGYLLLTVPTFTLLWGPQDEVAEHRRRYRLGELQSKVCSTGLELTIGFYFNYLLFIPILVARRLLTAFRVKVRSENDYNSPMINWMLSQIFRIDVWTAQRIHPRFGVSALVVARKPAVGNVK